MLFPLTPLELQMNWLETKYETSKSVYYISYDRSINGDLISIRYNLNPHHYFVLYDKNYNPKTTRVAENRIFIAPRKRLTYFYPVKS